MERTTKVNVITTPEKIWWKKTGGGSLRLWIYGRRIIIKPGQKFKASIEDIPQAFRDVIISLSKLPMDEPAPVVNVPEIVYTAKQRKKGGEWDVVNPSGKVLNEKALEEDVARKLVRDLAK